MPVWASVGSSQRYATKCNVPMKWISEYLVFTRDDTKHPCTRLTCIRGFAVGRMERYRRDRHLMLDCLKGEGVNLKMMVLTHRLRGRNDQQCLGLHECRNLG